MSKQTKEVISLVRCNRYHIDTVRQSMLALFEPWGGIDFFVKPGQRVLIKPNLLAGAPPEEAVTTHPLVIKALLELVREAGAWPYVGDSPGSASLEQVSEITGIRAVVREKGAILQPFTSEKHIRVQENKNTLVPLAAVLETFDQVINVGKLKTHSLTGLTAAVKNIYGCVVGKAKGRLHLEHPHPLSFARLLMDIYRAVNPGLSILDAVIAMEGTGPRSGRPRQAGLLMAGANGVALDCVAAAVTGFEPESVTTLAVAGRRGYSGAELSQMEVRGLSLEEAALKDFDRGAVSSGRIGALLARFPVSWLRNLQHRRRRCPVIVPEKCTGCGVCAEHCPPQVIRLHKDGAEIESGRCIRCYCCLELCSSNAVELFPR